MSTQLLFDHPACLMTHLSAHVQEQLVDVLAPLGIHPRQFGLLNLLIEENGRSQHQLAEPLNVHRNVMVGLVDEMERRGLVERRRHPTDRRAHAVHVLPAGRSLHTEAEALVNGFEAELLGSLEPDEAQTFVALLKRVFVHAGLDQDLHPGLPTSGVARAGRR
ncbi:MarR family winged helix-turn-helix transcriptional regulator [Streptacidiphilus griseoplanus]|uniref:MarR family winged helix-turn-helix transcriptional regulator n=1 Tax=Peterkaempfera griseoplana TaxID=66896 RepID=UPI001FE13D48|nr:MarR family transcriptional regulator [Peterkaempfera griseoplana]